MPLPRRCRSPVGAALLLAAASLLLECFCGSGAGDSFTGGWFMAARFTKAQPGSTAREAERSANNLENLEDTFARIDHDGDGRIDASELAEGLATLGNEFTLISAQEAKDLFAMADADNDGFLTLTEFVYWSLKAHLMLPAFRQADKDGNGCITMDEWRVAQGPYGRHWKEEDAEAVFKKADSNGNGEITAVEFMMINS
eukprot:TRINITY_DN3890_c0_g1_i1.p1 TRINITY_DN3890_c0_g1~~TRINITY_DN3890_c0_g1_i1.p1  ORF type:complete len:208 (+),score=45.25 TRINITY_DN3890_c0_g1_i1:28-624(+)